jgi:hypothetical protein
MSMKLAVAAATAFGLMTFAASQSSEAGSLHVSRSVVAAPEGVVRIGDRGWGRPWGWSEFDDRPYYYNQPAFVYVVPPPPVVYVVPQPVVVVQPRPVFVERTGGRCGWLYRTACETNSSRWWRRYRNECE